MAWTEQCRIDACAQVDHRVQTGLGKIQAFRALSEESGIPIRTLKRWYYEDDEESRAKNGPTNESEQNQQDDQQFGTCSTTDLNSFIENGERFGTIYADPPWNYGNQATRAATDNHYVTMSVQDIAALPIAQIADENAHLHIWTTNGFLFETKEIIDAWGFTYKSCMVWVKPQMGIGNYWRVSHEFLLFGIRGKAPFRSRSIKSWHEAKRGNHSAKPEAFRHFIEQASPGPYLELFARRPAHGWTVWGNEIAKNTLQGKLYG